MYEFDKLRESCIYKLNPMVNWSREKVWNYIHSNEIPYNVLHDKGYRAIGCWPCTRAVENEQDENLYDELVENSLIDDEVEKEQHFSEILHDREVPDVY